MTRPAPCCPPGRAAGLGLRVHGNQLSAGPGVRLAVELDAASVDHCTYLTGADVDALAAGVDGRDPVAGGASSPPARPIRMRAALLEAGVTVALATDCNPGSCYSSSMPFAIALAVREMRHDARPRRCGPPPPAAPGRCGATTSAGSSPGARADLAVLDAPSHVHLAYRPGVPLARALTW